MENHAPRVSGYAVHQSLMTLKNNRGLTLIELVMYIMIVTIISAIMVALFAAGEKSYTYTWRQTSILTWARQAMEGGGFTHGILWESRQAQQVTSLSASSLALTTPDAAAPQFILAGNLLQTVQASSTKNLAQHVNTLQLSYYNLNSAGHIIISTAAAQTTMVTAQVQMQGIGNKKYTFFTGAQLRNHS
jgi:hypothetical protein